MCALWIPGDARANEPGERSLFDTVIRRTPAPADKPKPEKHPPAAANAAPADAKLEPARGGSAQSTVVSAAGVQTSGQRTEFSLRLSRGVRVEVFTLAKPYRVVIDMPDAVFDLPDGTGRKGAGAISAFRYGLFADRKSRVVIDVSGPVRIEQAKMTGASGGGVDLAISLSPISAEEFGAGTGAGVSGDAAAASRPAVYDDQVAKPASARPVVLIDPGHGGIDPGALGASNILEKVIVLAVAQKVKRRLEALGRFDVHLTRSGDVFMSLDQRVKRSRELGADLFISLHADSIASKTYAPVVRGASVYTLSDHASDEQARLMAEKENASDLLAGVDMSDGEQADEVRNILIDLMKRETSNYSADFSRLLTGRLSKSISMSRDPQRSAAFKVLRQTHAPSVLIELGFMSNEADEALMQQAEWQGKVAQSIASAVESFFEGRTAKAP